MLGGGLVSHGSTWAGGHGGALVLLVVGLVSTAAAGTVGGICEVAVLGVRLGVSLRLLLESALLSSSSSSMVLATIERARLICSCRGGKAA